MFGEARVYAECGKRASAGAHSLAGICASRVGKQARAVRWRSARREKSCTALIRAAPAVGTRFENRCCASAEPQKSLRGFGG
jgi:hypothetical protein